MADPRRRGAHAMTVRVGGLAACVVLSAACGIQPTAVVDAGTPPSGGAATPRAEPVISGPDTFGDVYFVNAGKLTAVRRPILRDQTPQANRNGEGIDPITRSMQELLTGPSADEAAVGLRSELPPLPPQTPLLVTSADPRIVQLVMPTVADKLSTLATFQISCTVRAAAPAANRPRNVIVQRRYEDGRLKTLPPCPSGLGS